MTTGANTAPLRRRVADEVRALMRLGLPLLATNLAIAGMGFADTVMAGRLGARDLAAVAVGSGLWLLALLLGLGTLMGISPITAHAVGAGQTDKVGPTLRQGFWLSQALALLLVAALFFVEPLLRTFRVDPDIIPLTTGYVHAISIGMPGAFAYFVLRFMSEGIGRTRPIMYCAFTGLVVNVALNYVLMFGKLGFPRMGAVGCGLASGIALWCMFAMMLVCVRHHAYRRYRLFERWEWPRRALQGELLFVGAPIGAALLVEEGLFSFVGVIMGTLGANVVAGHQVALNYATTTFMVPLAVHSAIIIRVGQAVGAGDYGSVRLRAFTGIALCAAFMLCSAVALLLFSDAIVGFYTSDAAVRDIAVSLLFVAAIFQVSDGLSIGGAGALRGMKDTRVPMLFCLLAYWGIGLPLAWGLGIALGLGPRWVWVGFVAGLTMAALLLNARFIYITQPWRVRRLGMQATISSLPGG
jgi:MATE family multidrug resistance protein